LANQETFDMLFYDEDLSHRLTKRVNNIAKEDINQVLVQPDKLFSAIPKERFDFDKAKAVVIERTRGTDTK
jgi:hypothetical protein